MKIRALICAACALALIFALSPAAAAAHEDEAYYIESYDVNITVSEDNILSVTEDIDVFFNHARHGIYRDIPTENAIERADGTVGVTHAKVRNISCNADYSTSYSNSYVSLQIGDEDVTVTGPQHYTISYDYQLGQDINEGYDELYFNIIGDGWDTYIDFVTFSITMPKEFDESLLGFSSGAYGTAGTDDIYYEVSGTVISGALNAVLQPNEAFTVRLELEEGYFYFNEAAHIAKICAMALLPLLCVVFVLIMWFKFGRDKKLVNVVEFYPPSGMSSAEAALWYKGSASSRDAIGLLLELANEGYVELIDENGGKSYSIEYKRAYPDGADGNKKLFFDGLFEGGRTRVTSSDLENKFYKTLNKITARLNSAENKKRIYSLTSMRMRLLCQAAAAALLVVISLIFRSTFGAGERYIAFLTGIVLLVVAFALSFLVRKRTQEGHETLEKLSGFKTFLETAEKERLEMLVADDPQYFYGILPFAYVLGVSDKWIKKFENISIEPPEWYSGSSSRDFNTVVMGSFLSRTLTSASNAMTSVPQSSHSGSSGGGGGFSGGGSGGGGGGSW